MGANMFDPSGGFRSSSVFVIRKSSVTGAGPIVVTPFRDVVNTGTGDGPFTPQGADNDDPAATVGYYVGHDDQFFGRLDILRVGTPGATPTLSGPFEIDIPGTDPDSFAIGVPASGSTRPLDGGDIRLTDASIRNGKLYTAEAIAVNSSGTDSGTLDRDASRWFEFANLATTPTLNRSGTIFDSSATKKSYWMPSIAVSPQGHAVMGMSTSASTLHPNAAFSSMLSGTSTFSTPTAYTSASANYNVDLGDGDPTYRWGDFSHTSVDPCDGQTFWTIQEYVDGTNSWGVKVGKILAPPPATPASTSPTSVNAGSTSVVVTLTGTATSGSGFWDPGSGTCRIAASASGGVTVNSVTFTDATHVTLDLNTVGATGGAHTVTITNPDGQTASASVLTVNTTPQNTALPTITGTTKVGSVLTSTTGTWTGFPTPTFTRQWERCDLAGANCSDIASATGTTYTLVQADHGKTIRVKVTGTNTAGSATAESNQTTEIQYVPINTVLPTITGTVTKGQTLTAGNGTWDAFPASLTFAYQWQRCSSPGTCSNISGATASTYLLASADVGMTIRLRVTASNTAGASTPANSAETTTVTAAPANTALPTISGLTQVGATLTASNGTWTGSPTPTFTYQWEQCNSSGASCSDIGGATNSTYVLVSGDAGHTIRVKVTATNTVSAVTAESAATAVITVPPANTVLPSITGTAAVGQVLDRQRRDLDRYAYTDADPEVAPVRHRRCELRRHRRRDRDDLHPRAGGRRFDDPAARHSDEHQRYDVRGLERNGNRHRAAGRGDDSGHHRDGVAWPATHCVNRHVDGLPGADVHIPVAAVRLRRGELLGHRRRHGVDVHTGDRRPGQDDPCDRHCDERQRQCERELESNCGGHRLAAEHGCTVAVGQRRTGPDTDDDERDLDRIPGNIHVHLRVAAVRQPRCKLLDHRRGDRIHLQARASGRRWHGQGSRDRNERRRAASADTSVTAVVTGIAGEHRRADDHRHDRDRRHADGARRDLERYPGRRRSRINGDAATRPAPTAPTSSARPPTRTSLPRVTRGIASVSRSPPRTPAGLPRPTARRRTSPGRP